MELSLEGQVVLVTGAGVRVGRAIALELGRAGADVAVHCAHSREGADALAAELRALGRRAEVFQEDLTTEDGPSRLAALTERRLGRIDVLVNSAAIFERVPFVETADDVLDRQWALNARAPYRLTRAVAGGMLERGRGDVVNVLDLGGAFVPWRGYSAYCMTKAALAMLTECLALELAPAVRVNAVAPGTVMPPTWLPPEELERLRERIPQQRFGSADDVAKTVRFLLAGPRFITGQILAVDGGRLLGTAAR
jgi:pteridine reductase